MRALGVSLVVGLGLIGAVTMRACASPPDRDARAAVLPPSGGAGGSSAPPRVLSISEPWPPAWRSGASPRVDLDPVVVSPRRDPLAGLSDGEVARIFRGQRSLLGCASIGEPHRGALLNGMRLASTPRLHVVAPDRSWGTPGTVRALERAIARVHEEHPGTPRLHVGDLSREQGGYLRPHRSHQSGRDADLGYYYLDGEGWYIRGHKDNLDVERTFTLVEALLHEGDVEYLFIDQSIQALLRDHALGAGEDPHWLDQLFGVPGQRRGPSSIIRHAGGHLTHLHVRFYDNEARAIALRLGPHLRGSPPRRPRGKR